MLIPIDERRSLEVPGDLPATLAFCAEHFVLCAKKAKGKWGSFAVALCGGQTPKALFELLCRAPYRDQIDWRIVHLFWSDERSVPPNHPESNFRLAMEAGMKELPIPTHQIHRMEAEREIEKNALRYEILLRELGRPLDLVMLGIGEDGHTASLFPGTPGLTAQGRLAIANFAPAKNSWRMTLTLDAINSSPHPTFYVLGAKKRSILATVLGPLSCPPLPAQLIGTPSSPALFIADADSAGDFYRLSAAPHGIRGSNVGPC